MHSCPKDPSLSSFFRFPKCSPEAEHSRWKIEGISKIDGDPRFGKEVYDAGPGHHGEDNQDDPEHQSPQIGKELDPIFQEEENDGTHSRSQEVLHSTDQYHKNGLGRFRPIYEVGIGSANEECHEAPRKSCEGSRYDEYDELICPHVDAYEVSSLGIVADGTENRSKGGIDDPFADNQRDDEEDCGEEVEMKWGSNIDG